MGIETQPLRFLRLLRLLHRRVSNKSDATENGGIFQNPLRQEHGERDKPPKMVSSKFSNNGKIIGQNVLILHPIGHIPSPRLIVAVNNEKFTEYEPDDHFHRFTMSPLKDNVK